MSEHEPFLTFQDRLRRRSRFWAVVWSATEFCRLIAAGALFIGPTYTLVTWLFDFLKQTFDPEHYPEALREWSYYVLLILVFAVTQLPAWWLAGRVQTAVRRRFEAIQVSGDAVD